MANFSGTLYTSVYVNKYLADARDYRGKVIAIPFNHTITTEVATDTANLCVLPAGCEVLDWSFSNDAMGASTTMALGDAGSSTRFYPATSVTSAGKATGPLTAGMLYRPTADTIVLATFAGATPTAAAVLKGYFLVIVQA
jgi:hypothetical protein